MSKAVSIKWFPSGAEIIATGADIGDVNTPLKLNQNSFDGYTFNGVARNLRFYTEQRFDNKTFTITGIGCPIDADGIPTDNFGVISEEVVWGDISGYFYSKNIYKSVSAVFCNWPMAGNITVSSGPFGQTNYVFLDTARKTAFDVSGSVIFKSKDNINACVYSVYQSFVCPEIPNVRGSLDYVGMSGIGVSGALISTPSDKIDLVNLAESQDVIVNPDTAAAIIWVKVTKSDFAYFTFSVSQQGY